MHTAALARFDLQNKTAFITGSTRGLGAAMAEALAQHGAHVVLNGRDPTIVEKSAAALRDKGFSAGALAFDAMDHDACEKAIAEIIADRGQLDILVNNAGLNERFPVEELATASWQRVIDINLTACFVLAREAARHMRKRGNGRIINIGSVMSKVARPNISAYVATKHAIDGLTKALATEFGSSGITCNAIAPGYFRTDFNDVLINDEKFYALIADRTPVGRWAEPEELAAAVVFLASAGAAYVNGHLLTVDGGMTTALY